MKKTVIILFVLFSQLSNAAWLTSFKDAQKLSLASNKFMIVDFWATWCGPCKKMEYDSWSDKKVKLVLENYIQVKIDIDENRGLANKYGINSIPNMFVMDGNGKVVYTFSGYHDAEELKKELEKFELSIEFLSVDLINFYNNNNYNTALRVFQKYLDYSLFVDKDVRSKIINIGGDYLSESKKLLSKKAENYVEIKQKIDLYNYAYDYNYVKLNDKLSSYKDNDIVENNLNSYYFLKLIVAKGLNLSSLKQIEERVMKIEDFGYFEKKIDLIFSEKRIN
ncbi:thioredoxin family protein [Flavobacterium psychrotolerans]|uniref:Thioredoxin domain-containing protein n=1 Tax=Flavobacterium psychrotolerans TaxID=2169410 RepID=A0A2U1JND6_9FLAO|nr:thioredoxin family protein [Flavobacterium psychrotolerans]PWA06403.1 hypothetical protein DB895_02985 [Flavobacterium psychrotolerans]